ncbi:MAG: hypothetical protein WC748_00235 [Legionellales bacterium]
MNYMRPLGFVAIFIALFTWGLEWGNFVAQCPYCQVQRTMIGLLGILMVLPDYRYLSQFLTVIFGLFGTHVACSQIFAIVRDYNFNILLILAICAFCIMVGQILMLIARAYQRLMKQHGAHYVN